MADFPGYDLGGGGDLYGGFPGRPSDALLQYVLSAGQQQPKAGIGGPPLASALTTLAGGNVAAPPSPAADEHPIETGARMAGAPVEDYPGATRDKWLAMAMAGAGMAASRNPSALGAAGEGMAGGLTAFSQSRNQAIRNAVLAQQAKHLEMQNKMLGSQIDFAGQIPGLISGVFNPSGGGDSSAPPSPSAPSGSATPPPGLPTNPSQVGAVPGVIGGVPAASAAQGARPPPLHPAPPAGQRPMINPQALGRAAMAMTAAGNPQGLPMLVEAAKMDPGAQFGFEQAKKGLIWNGQKWAFAPGVSEAAAEAERQKAEATEPYKILSSMLSQAMRPIGLKPGEDVTTAYATAPIEVKQAFNSILAKLGMPPLSTPAAGSAAQATAPGKPPAGSNAAPSQAIYSPQGTLQSTRTLQGAKIEGEVLPAQYAEAQKRYEAANAASMELDHIDRSIDVMSQANWSKPGATNPHIMQAAKMINGVAGNLGVEPIFDPAKIGAWEDFNKQTKRMGMELVKTMFGGSREAASVINGATTSIPGADNTEQGARLVSAGIRQALQREKDFYEFLSSFAQQHAGSTFGADIAFNKANPANMYSRRAVLSVVPPAAIEMLKSDPSKADLFDKSFGMKGLAAMALQGK